MLIPMNMNMDMDMNMTMTMTIPYKNTIFYIYTIYI